MGMTENDNGPMQLEERINGRLAELNELKASLLGQVREYDKEISALKRVLNPTPESSPTKSKPGPKLKQETAKPKDEIAAAPPGANAQ